MRSATLAAILGLILVLIGCKKGGSGSESATEGPLTPERTVAPDQFDFDYPPGDTTLDEYDGKVVAVEGICVYIEGWNVLTEEHYGGQKGAMHVSTGFDSKRKGFPLQCLFRDPLDLSKYCPGQKVHLVGKFWKRISTPGGYSQPRLRDCVIVSTDGVMCPTRTVEEVVAELKVGGHSVQSEQSNSPKWTTVGRNSFFYMTGTVAKGGYPRYDGGNHLLFDTAKGPLRVSLTCDGNSPRTDPRIKAGSPVKLLVGRMVSSRFNLPGFFGEVVGE